MEKHKNSKGVIALLVMIIIVLLALIVLMATGTVNFKSLNTTTDNQNTSNENNANNSNNGFTINVDELNKFGKSDYNIIKDAYNSDYSFKLLTDGRININFENYISNISNAKDIKLFSSSSLDSTLYILTSNGDIYKYETSNYKSNNYSATKIDKYSNIKQMITYQTRKEFAGGCDYIILIDNNGKYYELDSFCA